MKKGIYSIYNIFSANQYIGQSVNIDLRFRQHLARLNAGTHKNKHLQAAWYKYGHQNFTFLILEETDDLTIREQYYIDKIGFKRLYNVCPASESRKGAKWTEESINRMKRSLKGRIPWNAGKTKVTHQQLSNSGVKKGNKPWNLGIPHSVDTKRKLAAHNKGRVMSEDIRKKISLTMKAKKINPHNYRKSIA